MLRLAHFLQPPRSSVQFSPSIEWVVEGDMRDNSAEINFQSFLQEVILRSSKQGQGRPLIDVVRPVYSPAILLTPGCNLASLSGNVVNLVKTGSLPNPLPGQLIPMSRRFQGRNCLGTGSLVLGLARCLYPLGVFQRDGVSRVGPSETVFLVGQAEMCNSRGNDYHVC